MQGSIKRAFFLGGGARKNYCIMYPKFLPRTSERQSKIHILHEFYKHIKECEALKAKTKWQTSTYYNYLPNSVISQQRAGITVRKN